jgi:hypothetical protein
MHMPRCSSPCWAISPNDASTRRGTGLQRAADSCVRHWPTVSEPGPYPNCISTTTNRSERGSRLSKLIDEAVVRIRAARLTVPSPNRRRRRSVDRSVVTSTASCWSTSRRAVVQRRAPAGALPPECAKGRAWRNARSPGDRACSSSVLAKQPSSPSSCSMPTRQYRRRRSNRRYRTDTADAEGASSGNRRRGAQIAGHPGRPGRVRRSRSTSVPPIYSALKRDGKPLYEYARAGAPVEAKARRSHDLQTFELS